MIKYFGYKKSDDWTHSPNVWNIEDEINEYAKNNNLKIIGATTDRSNGIFVVFEKIV